MLVETNPYSHRRVSIPGRLDVLPAKDGARFILRIAPAKLALAEKTLGAKIPAKIGGLAKTGETAVACIGPDEWYIWAGEGEADAIRQAFARLYESEPHSLVEVSHRETGIDISGPEAEWLLNAASPLNLAEMLAPGRRALSSTMRRSFCSNGMRIITGSKCGIPLPITSGPCWKPQAARWSFPSDAPCLPVPCRSRPLRACFS